MKSRSILLGLLASAAIPVTLADATTVGNTKLALLGQRKNYSLDNSCTLSDSSTNCSLLKTNRVGDIEAYSELWFKDISKLLLSGSMFSGCRSTKQKISPTPTRKFQNSGCIFFWQNLLEQKTNFGEFNSTASFTKSDRQTQPLVTAGFIKDERNSHPQPLTNSNALLSPSKHPSTLSSTEATSNSSFAPSLTPSVIPPQSSIKFPKLSRSSLIVSLPTADSSFIPQDTRLANPAPKTKRIASPFGWRRRPYSYQLQFHQGIDYGAPLGSPVVAVGDGIVTRVVSGCYDFGNLFCGGQLGNWIEIDHGNGILGIYGHLQNSSIAVEAGMKVWKNQEIARVGSSGWSTGAHLDFRLKIDGKYEDPAKYLTPPKLVKAIVE